MVGRGVRGVVEWGKERWWDGGQRAHGVCLRTAPMTVRPSASRSSSTMALCKYCLSSVKLSAVLDVRSTSPAGSVDGSCGGEAAEATGADGWGNRCCRTHSHSRRSSKQPRVRSTSSCLPRARRQKGERSEACSAGGRGLGSGERERRGSEACREGP